jgi:hypothetical protein
MDIVSLGGQLILRTSIMAGVDFVGPMLNPNL